MKKLIMAFMLSVLVSCCAGCWREESGLQEEGTEKANTMEDMTENGRKGSEGDAVKENTLSDKALPEEGSIPDEEITTAAEAAPGYIDIGGILTIKEPEGYTYKVGGFAVTVEHPLTCEVASDKGGDEGFTMTVEMRRSRLHYGGVPYREVKKASYLISWQLDLLDGTLEEYTELSEGMGRSIYVYEKRQPIQVIESETYVPEYGYRAIYGMDGSSFVYIIDFPVNTPIEEAKLFLDSIQIEPELFAIAEQGDGSLAPLLEALREAESKETQSGVSGYITDGLIVTELDGYDYTYMKNKRQLPFRAVKREGGGAGTEFEMVKEVFAVSGAYSERKEAEDIKKWGIGCGSIEGPLVEFQDLGDRVGLSLYKYETRSVFAEDFPEYGYIALYGMSGVQYAYGIFFPKDMPLEEVKRFLDSIQVGPELFQ